MLLTSGTVSRPAWSPLGRALGTSAEEPRATAPPPRPPIPPSPPHARRGRGRSPGGTRTPARAPVGRRARSPSRAGRAARGRRASRTQVASLATVTGTTARPSPSSSVRIVRSDQIPASSNFEQPAEVHRLGAGIEARAREHVRVEDRRPRRTRRPRAVRRGEQVAVLDGPRPGRDVEDEQPEVAVLPRPRLVRGEVDEVERQLLPRRAAARVRRGGGRTVPVGHGEADPSPVVAVPDRRGREVEGRPAPLEVQPVVHEPDRRRGAVDRAAVPGLHPGGG